MTATTDMWYRTIAADPPWPERGANEIEAA